MYTICVRLIFRFTLCIKLKLIQIRTSFFISIISLEHWDVNNENLHGHAFEDLTKHADINREIFNWVHAKDHNVKLFLNEYNVISWRDTTTVSINL